MTKQALGALCAFMTLTVLSGIIGEAEAEADRFWPTWRGPMSTGVAPGADPPVEWSETTNIRWKVEIPGRGSSSPIVWGDRVFLLTAVPVGVDAKAGAGPVGLYPDRVHEFTVIAYDRADGSVAWRQVAREEQPHEGTHRQNGSWASGSAVTDGEYLFAYFGSRGLYCYDLDGNLVWDVDLGNMWVFPLLKSLLPVVVAFLLPTTDTLDHRRVGNGTHRHGLFQEPMEELPAMA